MTSRMQPKKIPAKYVTSERVERVDVAGQATKRREADMKNRCLPFLGTIFISAIFYRTTEIVFAEI